MRAASVPRVALVRHDDLGKAEPHDEAAQIRVRFPKLKQMIDRGA